MKNNQVFIVLLTFILFVSACALANGQDLVGTQWDLQRIDGDAIQDDTLMISGGGHVLAFERTK